MPPHPLLGTGPGGTGSPPPLGLAQLLHPPGLHGESRRKGEKTEKGTWAPAEAQALPACAPLRPRDCGAAEGPLTQERHARLQSAYNFAAVLGLGTPRGGGGGAARGLAGRRAAGPGRRGWARKAEGGAYLPWCCRAVAAAAASCWLGEAGRWEGAQPASRRGRSRASGWSALIASVTWPRTLPAPVDCRPTHRPAGGGGPVAAGPGLLPGPCVLLAGFQVRLSGTSGLAPVAHLFGTARPQCPRELGI